MDQNKNEAQVQEKHIHTVFIIGLVLKAFSSLLEIAGGLLFLVSGSVIAWASYLIQQELIDDPNDFVATHLAHFLPYVIAHSPLYAAIYLLSHGIIKVFLVICLLRNKLWAYPATVVVLSIFIVYQLYRLSVGFSLILSWLTLFDILLIIVTWHEYRVQTRAASYRDQQK